MHVLEATGWAAWLVLLPTGLAVCGIGLAAAGFFERLGKETGEDTMSMEH